MAKHHTQTGCGNAPPIGAGTSGVVYIKRAIVIQCQLLSLVALGGLLAPPAVAQRADAPSAIGSVHLVIPDVELVDQYGKHVRFKSDVLQNHTAAISFIFTTCTTVCLPIGANFAKMEKILQGRAGHDIILLSISVDPVTDTPERLREWSRKFGGGPGWTLLTGTKRNVDDLLQALGAFTADKLQHSTTMLIGAANTGSWRRLEALTPPQRAADALLAVAGHGL